MFVKLNNNEMLSLFWVLDCQFDKNNDKKVIIYLVNGTDIALEFNTVEEAQEQYKVITDSMDNMLPSTEPIPVTELPTDNIKPGRVYIVPCKDPETNDLFEEWTYVNGDWELLGTQKGDFNNYYTISQIDEKLRWKEY